MKTLIRSFSTRQLEIRVDDLREMHMCTENIKRFYLALRTAEV